MTLNHKDIEINVGLNIDSTGFIFKYDNRIFRVIYDSAKDDVLYLFQSGAVDELNRLNLITRTTISDFVLEGYDLILEHEKIDVVIFPGEWSFTMLKDAALLVIKINKVLQKYGFQTHDAHGYNVLFHYSKAKFVDFGSFERKTTKKYWCGKDNFREFYIYALYMWSKGNPFLAKSFLIDDGKYINTKDYEFFIYKYSLARLLPLRYLERFFYYLRRLRNIQKFTVDEILIVKRIKIKRQFLKVIMILSKAGLIPNNHTNFNRLERKINKIKSPKILTEWSNYHSNPVDVELYKNSNRFNLIVEQVKKLNLNRIFEIGGNQGLLAEELGKSVPTVICSDIDESAVDYMYHRIKNLESRIYPVLLDFLSPVNLSTYYAENYTAVKRYKAEAVLALALTHHLILTRKTPIDVIFKALSIYTSKYLFVEFMPLGIKRGKVPSWYNLDWFRKHFKKYFNLLFEFPSEADKSRILLIGTVT